MITENKSENNRIPEHTGQLPSGENGGLGTTYLENQYYKTTFMVC